MPSPSFDLSSGGWTTGAVVNGSLNSTVLCAVPANVVDGDVMLACCFHNSVNNPPTITLPAGWTSIVAKDTGNGTYFAPMELAYRVAASEPVSYEWGVTVAGGDDVVAIFRLMGVDVDAGLFDGAVPAIASSQSTAPSSPAVTTTTADSLLVTVFSSKNGNVLAGVDQNAPSGMTVVAVRNSRANSSGLNWGVAYEVIPTPGGTGARPWTGVLTTAQYWSAASLALLGDTVVLEPLIGILTWCEFAVPDVQTVVEPEPEPTPTIFHRTGAVAAPSVRRRG